MLRNARALLSRTRTQDILRIRPPALVQSPALCRAYAHSRFQERRPGTSRLRDRPERVTPRKRSDSAVEQEDNEGGAWHDVKLGPFNFRVWQDTPRRPPPPKEEEELSFQQQYHKVFSQQRPSTPPPPEQEQPHASQPEQEESQLWEASMRRPSSDPKEGLERLLMSNDMLIITRQIEMLNIFVGFEQSNRYVITNENEEILGYIAEEPRGFLSMFARQLFRTHRPFRALVMDSAGSPILWLRRPFAWINSRMFVQRLKDYHDYNYFDNPVLDTFAEVQQRWHLWRRRYDLFLRDQPHRILSEITEPQPEPEPQLEPESFKQLARIDDGFLSWHFTLRGARGEELASVDRRFRGFGREVFTDTGRYYVRFGPRPPGEEASFWPGTTEGMEEAEQERQSIVRNLTLEERCAILATAVNIDFDYFSRHSGGGGWGPLLFLGVWE